MIAVLALLPATAFFLSCSSGKKESASDENESMDTPAKNVISIEQDTSAKKVDVNIDGQLFTSYIFPDDIMKPVLYPIVTSGGNKITRGFPIENIAGERVDHPHHVGIWFNYGDVNGLDFWNNSTAIAADKKENYGTIKHNKVMAVEELGNSAKLSVSSEWQKPDGTVLLEEKTEFRFFADDNVRIIDRTAILTAQDVDVSLKDNKEGMIAIRVARALEHPATKPERFTDASGIPTEVPTLNNEGVNGRYYSSEGVEGDDVWGTRAHWVNLASSIGDEEISVILIDHPDNPGYPTYWHARGYGLFAANPLGQAALSDGKDVLNYSIKKGESATFKYRFVIYSGEKPDDSEIKSKYLNF